MNFLVPKTVVIVLEKLEDAGFEAFVVGGCVRDLLLGVEPKDWDVATSAKPEEILEIFPEGKYENNFGTVLVPEKYLVENESISNKVDIGEEVKAKLEKFAKTKLKKMEPGTYDEGHSDRVLANALEIAKDYPDVNTGLLEVAVLFHDIGKIEGCEGHAKASQLIFEKVAGKLLKKDAIEKIKSVIEHDYSKESKSIERQIVVEADLLDGISVERCKNAQKTRPESHFGWIKDQFNEEGLYGFFVTQKGKKLLRGAILDFNKEDFGFKLAPFKDLNSGIVEITTYRIESKYSDKRHPDGVKFAKTLEEDLSRRDFTVNAMALKNKKQETRNKKQEIDKPQISNDKIELTSDEYEIVDLFGGREDLENQLIRAVGNANERFDEDALRMMRAVRFVCQLSKISNFKYQISNKNQNSKYQTNIQEGNGDSKKYCSWNIEQGTFEAIKKNASNLKFVSQERIKDELEKIILSDAPAKGVDLLVQTGLMQWVMPEVLEGVGVRQNRHHYHGPYNTVYAHMLASLENCPSKKLEVRLAAFLHDIGKPGTKRGEGEFATFHGHEYLGARLVDKLLNCLKFPRKVVEKTVLLVKNHMFYYNVDEVGEAGVRRVIKKVGLENLKDLIDVRISDRLGSGVAKAVPYKLRHFQYMVEKVSQDPVSVGQLKLKGDELMSELGLYPGPKIGAILEVLLAEVIDDPALNDKRRLLEIAKELEKQDLARLRAMAKKKIEKEREKEDEQIKGKHWVK